MATIQDSFINLRNELKTWITNNLELKTNKSDLTASDGTMFQFASDENGNYGYIVNNKFIPFDDLSLLPEALKYSKLVTEDMSFDDICTALSNRFPAFLNLYTSSANEGGFAIWEKVYGADGTISFGDMMTIRQTTRNGTKTRVYSKLIDMTNYKKLHLEHISNSSDKSTYDWVLITVDKKQEKIDLGNYSPESINSSNSIVKKVLYYNTNATVSGKVEIDISTVIGEHYISIVVQNNNSSYVQTQISNMYLQ